MSRLGQSPPRPLRFTVWSLFRLQLILAPLFLIPLYLSAHRQHPYLFGSALLLAPAVYVAALLLLFPTGDGCKPRVFGFVRQGAKWGILFGVLSMVPATVVEWAPRFNQWRAEARLVTDAFFYASVRKQYVAHPGLFVQRLLGTVCGGPLLLAFILLHYAFIGAAVGGVIGLMINRKQVIGPSSEVHCSSKY